jgi:outer membrane protein insertion porin family
MRTRRWAWTSAILLLVARPAPAQVQTDAQTEVRSIRLQGVRSIREHVLRDLIHTRERGAAYGLRVALGKIPLVPGPGPLPFSPLELQQDVVRVRNHYAANGFFRAQVHYTVERDDAKNLLDITFVVDEGRPFELVEIAVVPWDSLGTLPVPEGERRSWERLERSLKGLRGRMEVEELRKARVRLVRWWQDRGHPRVVVAPRLQRDTLRFEGRLTYRVSPGPAYRFGDVTIEGNRRLSRSSVRRLVPIEPGDRYSAARLEDAELALRELDIVRGATVDVPSISRVDSSAGATGAAVDSPAVAVPADSLLTVRVRVTESELRLVSGDLGYVTDAGLSSEARWRHGNFTGGGRSLTVTGLAQTGWLAVTDDPDKRYRLAASLKQPAIAGRRVSAVVGPFVEHRNDAQDRSTQYGLNTTLVYRDQQFRSLSLDYQIAKREVYEYRFGDLASGDIDLLTFLTQVAQGVTDSLGTELRSSTFSLSGTLGTLDDPANPRRGVLLRPSVQVTAPTAWSSTTYWRYGATANGYVPIGRRAVIATRVSIGSLAPFGKSIPGSGDNPQSKFLELRDVAFTAGGIGDVRAWENRLLGPKVPDVRFDSPADTLVPDVEGYVPLGGFARGTFSVELQLPLPGFGPNLGTHVFLDGGRVWTEDARFGMEGDALGQERLFVGTGAGLDIRTPVGPIKIGVGYKLNPSITDLVDAEDIFRAANAGTSFDDLKRHQSHRWQWYLAVGASY